VPRSGPVTDKENAMYKVIGKLDTRAFRVLWMLEELGLTTNT